MRQRAIDMDSHEQPVASPSRAIIPVQARKAFFASIVRELKAGLPPELREFRHRGDFNLMKVWYGHYRVHYEVVIDQQIDRIEIGLHFEDGPASTLGFLTLLDARILEIKDRLGPEVELERWTQSWGRIYDLRSLTTLDDRIAIPCGKRLVEFITLLQPMIDASGIRLERPGA